MKPWAAYRLSPIDYRWDMLPTVEDVTKIIADNEAEYMRNLT